MLYKMTFFSSIRNANIFSFLMSISSVSVSQSSISDKVAPFTHPQDEYEEVSPTDLAARILNGYENVVNSLMILAGGGRHRTKIMPSEYQATLTLEQDEKVFTYNLRSNSYVSKNLPSWKVMLAKLRSIN